MDLTRLAPAPWVTDGCRIESAWSAEENVTFMGNPVDLVPRMVIYDEGGHSETDAEFICLARNAFEVMMRRGWGVGDGRDAAEITDGPSVSGTPGVKWAAISGMGWADRRDPLPVYDDPFTALVEADAWYKINVEQEGKQE